MARASRSCIIHNVSRCWAVQASMDPNNIAAVLAEFPFHVHSAITMSDIYQTSGQVCTPAPQGRQERCNSSVPQVGSWYALLQLRTVCVRNGPCSTAAVSLLWRRLRAARRSRRSRRAHLSSCFTNGLQT